ncbi:MAG: permease [Acidimicrobiales bacterium]
MDPIVNPPLGAITLDAEGNAASILERQSPSRRALAVAAVVLAGTAAAGLTWAKWYPYAEKLGKLWDTRVCHGPSIHSTGADATKTAPTWHAAWSFTVAYGQDIWVALVVAIVIAAAMEALVPRQRIVSLLTRRSALGGTLLGGLVALPAMMCTCCSAPLTVTLRRNGVPTASALGFWLSNPVLNPAVIVFLALVAPWQWVVTRAIVGAVLVLAVPYVVTCLVRASASSEAASETPPVAAESFDLGAAPRLFLTAVGRLGITLVPEYFVVVLLIGAFRGWLLPLGADTLHWGFLAVLVAAVAGVLMVIPTAGEIPILLGLAALGISPAVLGALLIALPAISLPSMAMVGRTLSWKVVGATAAAVAVFALIGGGLLSALA